MEISQRLLGMLFVWAVGLGFVLGGVYDVLRITRILCGLHYVKRFSKDDDYPVTDADAPRKTLPLRRKMAHLCTNALVFTEDLLFGVVCAVSLVILLYYANDGQFRALAVWGMACGFFVYYHTLGRLVMLFSEAIVMALRRIIRWIVRLLLVPLRVLGCLLNRTVGQPVVRLIQGIRHKRSVRYTDQKIEACIRLASQGFGLLSDPSQTSIQSRRE